jgi:hypothetical protein
MPEKYQLLQKQSLSLENKVRLSMMRIRHWYSHWDGDVCVLDTGTEASKVLKALVLECFPDVPVSTSVFHAEHPFMDFQVTDEESEANWLRWGCNAYECFFQHSRPLSVWSLDDIQLSKKRLIVSDSD